MFNTLLVAIGGAIGAVLRYQVAVLMRSVMPAYAASGTLLVNIVGSFVIGYYLGTAPDSKTVSESTRLFLVVGVIGGLTTFSSLTHETIALARHPHAGYSAGFGHLVANVVLGLGAVWLGAWIAHERHST